MLLSKTFSEETAGFEGFAIPPHSCVSENFEPAIAEFRQSSQRDGLFVDEQPILPSFMTRMPMPHVSEPQASPMSFPLSSRFMPFPVAK